MLTRLYIANLPYQMHDSELEDQLRQFGVVVDVRILRTEDGASRGIGFAHMSKASAARALEAGAFDYLGRRAYIRLADGQRAPRELAGGGR